MYTILPLLLTRQIHPLCNKTMTCLALPYFLKLSHKLQDFGENVFEMKHEFWFSLWLLSRALLTGRRIQWDIIIYWLKSSCTVPVILDINNNLTISLQILAESPITKCNENLYMEGKLLHAHRHDKNNTNSLQLYKCTLQTKPNITILQYDIHM